MKGKTIKILNRIIALLLSVVILSTTGEITILAESLSDEEVENASLSDNKIVSEVEETENDIMESDTLEIDMQSLETGMTRAEWLALLIEKLGLSIDASKYPDNYYSDISTSDSYYVTAMIATEYGLLDAEDDGRARMNDSATREFAVHTLNQYLGLKPDSENYTFNDKESCKYPDDIQVAVNQGWIALINGNFEPERLVSSEEVSNMLEKAVSLQAADKINENYDSRFNFASYVKVVPQGTEVTVDGNQTVSIVDLRQTINAGDTFAVYVGEIPSLYLAKSVTVNGNTTVITTGEADAERAILSIDSEGISEVEISDIEAANELSMESVETNARAKELTQTYGLQIKKGDILFSGDISLNGVKANVVFNLTDLKLKHKVNTVKNTYHITLCGDIASSIEIDWDAYDAAKISGTYVLCSANVAGVGNANITLNYSFSGRIETYNEASFEVGFDYNNAQGYRFIKKYTKKNSTNNSTTNASLALRASFDVNIMNIIKGSVYEQIGAKARYTSKTYTDGKSPNRCQNFTTWLFVDGGIRITYGIGSLKGALVNKTFVVFDENNSPAYTSFHCEDGVQVSKCSRGSSTGRYGSWGYFSPVDTQYGSYIGNGSTSQGINSNGEPYTIYTYELDSDNNATITGYNGNVSALSIPSTIDGYNVTGIGSRAFSGNTRLVSVRIPDSVTKIDNLAFSNCGNLSKVTLSKKLTELGYGAFYDCDLITEIEIPKSLEKAGHYLQYYDGPFAKCDGLKKVTFENGTTKIVGNLFYGCTGLEEITIPDTITAVEHSAFNSCTNLSKVTFSKNLTTIDASAFSGNTRLVSVKIPDSVTKIDNLAFSNCGNLSKVTLSKKLTELGYGAFYDCDLITEIEIPKSLEKAGHYLQYYDGPFAKCDGLKKVTFENGTTKIVGNLFYGCTGLEEVTIPDTITAVEHSAFNSCTNLSKVTFSKNLTTIDASAFSGNTKLASVRIPDSVTDIDNYAFQNCISLKEVYIPDSVTDMGTHIFYGCTSLETVHLPNIRQNIMQYMFYNCVSLKNINLPDTLTCIQKYAFYNCDSLTGVVIPKNVTEIQTYAFYDCDNLIKATIPDSVTTMGTYAFSHCDNLENVTLGTGLTVIPSHAFANDGKLNNIIIPYRVSTIKDNAFNACTSLTDVTIPRSVTSIGSGVFSYPSSMTIYGIKGTYGETYANSNGIRFVNREIHATEVKLNINSLEINKGDSNRLVLTVTPSEFTDEVNWKSTNTSVATVADDGTVKGVGAGTADIKVTVGNISTSCKITIRQPVTSISLSSTSKSMEAGETVRITATAYPSNANNRTILWSSSDPSIAVVSNDGVVTALRKGSTTITARAQDGSNVSRSCNITVTSNTYQVSDVSRMQSAHPYENNCKDKWVYTCNGAVKLNITFSEDTALEQNFDYIYIYDKEGNQIGCFTGTELAGRTITINGDTVSIKLQSDGSGTAYGFKVATITTGDISQNPGASNPDIPDPDTSIPEGPNSWVGKTGTEGFVYRLYNVAMSREADESGFRDWNGKLQRREQSAAEVARGFIFSKEFMNRCYNDVQYVKILYRTMFGREADEGGLNDWLSKLENGMSREYVFRGFAESQEFSNLCDSYGVLRGSITLSAYRDQNVGATGFIARLYTKMLGRGFDEEGLEYWCRKYLTGENTIEEVATVGFLHSQELKNLNLSDTEFVTRMYRTFLNREPDEAGLADWVNRLETGRETRDSLVYGFTLSKEFGNIKASYGL